MQGNLCALFLCTVAGVRRGSRTPATVMGYTSPIKVPSSLFGIVCFVVLVVLLPSLWAQRLLYTNAEVRTQVQQALELTAQEEGILLSGFSITSLTSEELIVSHRAHARGADAHRCFAIDLESSGFAPRIGSGLRRDSARKLSEGTEISESSDRGAPLSRTSCEN